MLKERKMKISDLLPERVKFGIVLHRLLLAGNYNWANLGFGGKKLVAGMTDPL